MNIRSSGPKVYGLIAEFENEAQILEAAERVHAAGYRRIDAYTPYPVHGLAEAIHFEDSKVPWTIFFGGLAGCIGGFLLQVYVSKFAYPLNVGGRPLISWPQFIPVTFECTVLLASFAAFFGVLAINGLPRPYNPLFNARRFELASQDRFFLCVEATDPLFDRERTAEFLRGLGPSAVSEVETDY